MSYKIKHECGIAYLRLRKPIQYYIDKYNTPTYPVNKMFLMMHKQRNRGQDGSGVASLKLNLSPGKRYISRYRSVKKDSIQGLKIKFNKIHADNNICKVSIVGVGMKSNVGVAEKMFETLAKKNINIQVISTSEIKVSVLIELKKKNLALRALHTAYKLDD